ncbi:MAG: hypothetical protein ACOYJL_03365 [Tractidigestivibacter sp.]|uniref:hypothetical protein n=1 Tax=Tractidigestivibacter sp. TaxID=2847320 RepID=UPI003D8FA94E
MGSHITDLSEILGYIGDKDERMRSEEDLRDLFTVTDEHGKTHPSAIDTSEMREILHNLYWLLSIVLRISPLRDAYLPPRDANDYKDLKMWNILEAALGMRHGASPKPTGPWDKAVQVIRGLKIYAEHGNNRSEYLRQLREKSGKVPATALEPYQYAEAIVDLCYNYACEISICNSSKRYDVEDLSSKGKTGDTFRSDFVARLNETWGDGVENSQRYLQPESNTFEQFPAERYAGTLPDIRDMVRYAGYAKAPDPSPSSQVFVPRYEFHQEMQRQDQRRLTLSRIWTRIGFALLCVLIACLIELGMNEFQDLFDDQLPLHTTVVGIVETLLFLLISEYVTNFISDRIDGFLSLSEALGSIGQLCSDATHTILRKTGIEGASEQKDTGKRESPSVERPIPICDAKAA